jgi:hypothetical protein
LQLLAVLASWIYAIEKGEQVHVSFMDFHKAFDQVSHHRLHEVLKFYGIQGPLFGWIQSFLNGRKQRVCLEGTASEWTNVLSGVPQGSVLGPTLFVLFVNTLPDVVTHSQIYLFADDAKVFKTITRDNDRTQLQQDLDAMLLWTHKSLLQFNPDKCTKMTIRREKPTDPLNTPREYQIADTTLKNSTAERDLGVIMESDLSFEQHMYNKINKANRIMAVIRRTYSYLDDDSFLLLYKGLVRPHLEYCNQVWQPHLHKHTDSIENVQRRATKLIPGYRDLSYEERLRKLKLPTLAFRRIRGDMIEAYKIITGKYDTTLRHDSIRFNQHQTRGHKYKLEKPFARTNLRKYSFFHRIVDPWNNLPSSVVEADSINSFERRLDKHWKNHPMLYNHHPIATTTAERI